MQKGGNFYQNLVFEVFVAFVRVVLSAFNVLRGIYWGKYRKKQTFSSSWSSLGLFWVVGKKSEGCKK